MAEIASLVVNVAGNITGAVNSFKSLEQTSRSTAKKIESNFSSLKNIGVGLFSSAILKNIVDTGIQFQSIRQSLQAVTGSAQGMNDAMKFIDQTAQRTGVNILNASKDFRLLVGASQGAGYAMQDIKNIFGGVADASLVLGMRADDVTGLMRAFGQIMSKGTVQAEELKGQIGDRLPGALGLASKAMGVTNAQLLKMMETGTLMSKDFLPKFSEQLKKTYGDLVPLFQGTALKAFNDFDNAMLKLKDSIATSGLLDLVTKIMNNLTSAINSVDGDGLSVLKQAFSSVSMVVDLFIKAIKQLKEIMDSLGITVSDLVMAFLSYKSAILAITAYKVAYNAVTATATAETIKEATAESASVVAKRASGVATTQLTNAINSLNYTLMLLSQNTRVATAGLIGYNASAEKATTATNATNTAIATTATASTIASRTLGVLGTVASRIVFPVALAWSFYEVIKSLADQSGVTAQAFEDMVGRMSVLELNSSIGKTKDKIEELREELKLYSNTDLASLGDGAGVAIAQQQKLTKALEEAQKKLETYEKRRLDLAKGQSAEIEQKRLEKEQNIALKQQDVLDKVNAERLKSLGENRRKLEAEKLATQRLLQDIYESSLDESGNVQIDYSKKKQIEGKDIWSDSKISEALGYRKQIEAKVNEEIMKEALADVSKFQKELQSIYDMKEGLKGGTEFSKEWGNFLSKFSKERIAEITGSGEINKLKEEFQELFNAKKVKEFSDELDNLKVEDFTRNLSEADKYAYSLNATFEKLGTTGNEALEKKNELIKQFNENQKNIQKDNYLANYGTAEERWQMRKQELEKQWGELSVEQRKKVMAENEKLFKQDETIYAEKLKGVTTWGEAYGYWLEKTQASQKTWGEQIVSVFDTMSNAMTSAMTDFLDITSDGFADFGKMATSILQEVYKEILKVMVVKPLVNSIMGAFGGGGYVPYTDGWASAVAWNGGIANGSGFQRFASGYIAGGGYSSVDSLSNDKIPALISKGEAVIPASSVNANRGLISALISGRGRKFANGYIDGGSGGGNVKVEIINESGEKMQITKSTQTTDMEGMVIQAWISGISKNRYGSRDMLSQGVR